MAFTVSGMRFLAFFPVSENDNGITVVLDTNLSDELLEEGFVREIISKVQTMRKEAGFEVMDKIESLTRNREAEKIFAENCRYDWG